MAAGDGSSAWIPATHLGELDWVPDSSIQPDSTLAIVGI